MCSSFASSVSHTDQGLWAWLLKLSLLSYLRNIFFKIRLLGQKVPLDWGWHNPNEEIVWGGFFNGLVCYKNHKFLSKPNLITPKHVRHRKNAVLMPKVKPPDLRTILFLSLLLCSWILNCNLISIKDISELLKIASVNSKYDGAILLIRIACKKPRSCSSQNKPTTENKTTDFSSPLCAAVESCFTSCQCSAPKHTKSRSDSIGLCCF